MRILPITCYRPEPKAAAGFAAPPYDVFDRLSARAYVAAHPSSFLAIDLPETAFGPDQDPYAPEVYAKAGELIRQAAYAGTLLKDVTPCLYLYRLQQAGHSQTGVVCACSVEEYEQGVIRRHENTTPAKTLDRARHIRATGAQTGPVLLAYRDSMAIDAIVDAARAADPIYDFVDEQGVRQTVWRVARPVAIEALQLTFATIGQAYIADGHHRASAATQVCHDLRDEAKGRGELPSDSFLAVLFPASQLSVLAYHRVVSDTAGLSEQALLDALHDAGFEASEPTADPVSPQAPHRFGLYAFGRWRALWYVGELPDDAHDPTRTLDASLLQERVLGPILRVDDPRTSERISFVGGNANLEELARQAGAEGVAFSLYPTSTDELMAVSDAGLLMPPKSTWFEPKLKSGLFIRRID